MKNYFKRGVPDRTKVKLTFYWETGHINDTDRFTVAADGGSTYFQFRGNGPYDPDTTLGGTTAQMFAFYNQVYRSYQCTYSKLYIYIDRADYTATYADATEFFCGVMPMDDALGTTDWPQSYFGWETTPNAKVKRIIANSGNQNGQTLKLKHAMSTQKLYGRKSDPSLDWCLVNTLPSNGWNYNVVCINNGPQVFNGKARFYVKYWVTFSEPTTNLAEFS